MSTTTIKYPIDIKILVSLGAVAAGFSMYGNISAFLSGLMMSIYELYGEIQILTDIATDFLIVTAFVAIFCKKTYVRELNIIGFILMLIGVADVYIRYDGGGVFDEPTFSTHRLVTIAIGFVYYIYMLASYKRYEYKASLTDDELGNEVLLNRKLKAFVVVYSALTVLGACASILLNGLSVFRVAFHLVDMGSLAFLLFYLNRVEPIDGRWSSIALIFFSLITMKSLFVVTIMAGSIYPWHGWDSQIVSLKILLSQLIYGPFLFILYKISFPVKVISR